MTTCKQALQSVIEWTDDTHTPERPPSISDAHWYEQRLLMIRNAARAALQADAAARDASKEEIARAREDYATSSDCDIEIDDEPAVSIADGGVWVAAWVWVHDARDADACDDCGHTPALIGCPDGAQICQSCFDAGAH